MIEQKIDVETLCELWAEGRTATQIADYFGVTSQTVLTRISKMRRAGDSRVGYRSVRAAKTPVGAVTDDAGNRVAQADYDALLDRVYRLERKLRGR